MIGIITVFFSENYGSVLQAYALRQYLQTNGKNVVYIDTRNRYSSHSLKRTVLSIGYKILHLDFKNAFISYRKYRNFSKTLAKYPYVPINAPSLDTVVVGSDTVWDVDAKYFLKSQDLFWPRLPQTVRVVSYAASVGNSELDRMQALNYPLTCLSQMCAISVRDNYSQKVISELLGKKVPIVCDPTLLLHCEDYDTLLVPVPQTNYAAVYLFEELDPKCVLEIKHWAEQNHLRLVSVCKDLKWCDATCMPSVENFVSFIKNASYVITNTFHGTIFSILFHRQFVCLGYGKKKISEFLTLLGLTDRIIRDTSLKESDLDMDIDYELTEARLDDIRRGSYQYLLEYVVNPKDREGCIYHEN